MFGVPIMGIQDFIKLQTQQDVTAYVQQLAQEEYGEYDSEVELD